MGNQLTGIAPSQIFPVEHYLTDVPEYEFDQSLGSTRFFKVARAKCQEGLAVVKVCVIHDPSLPLKSYRDQLEDIHGRLQGASNCLPFQKPCLSDKAALLFRQYVKDSLYDRISTRPFLNNIEKKWVAFQLLCALNQCHKLNVCHGDIKSENVMVTSWNWVLLTDFASFKPTYLPEDNPADFGFFFDTSRRRTCYIAPERFVESSWRTQAQSGNLDLTTSEVKKGDLTPAMDIFSLGCVITELFTDGSPPFDLSHLLAYRTGDYSPWKLLHLIDDPHIRDLVRHMMQKDAHSRLTAEEYLVQQRGKAFPEYFYTFLKLYLQRFAAVPILPADERITRLKRDLSLILERLEVSETEPAQNTSLVLVISLVTASLRSLHFGNSKLMALEILLLLSKYVTSEVILDRLIPFMLHLVTDPFPRVRAAAVMTITHCLSNVKTVPISDANIFPEYILPQMSHLTQDMVSMVRVAYAQSIALLAETALRFLEIVQLNQGNTAELDKDRSHDVSQYKASYDAELQALHEMIQQKVVTLLSDPDNTVKQTLLQNGITRLCVFFGRQKANDVLLSHMITFLNDKYDWHLRGAFFDSIVGVAAYVGWQSSTILKPLLQQGLGDTEEYVIHKTMSTLTSLTELGLLQKPIVHELLTEVVPFFCHPNTWIRQGAVGFVSSVARSLNIADVHCNLLPLVQPFLQQTILQVDQEVILLNALREPITRAIYDYILRSPHIDRLFGCLQDRQLIRNICRAGHQPNYGELEDNLTQVLRKLTSQGMTPSDEDKLMAMKDFMLKLHRARASSVDSLLMEDEGSNSSGNLNLSSLNKSLVRRHADLYKPGDPRAEGQQYTNRRIPPRKFRTPESPTMMMNEDWKQMFGSTDSRSSSAAMSGSVKVAKGDLIQQQQQQHNLQQQQVHLQQQLQQVLKEASLTSPTMPTTSPQLLLQSPQNTASSQMTSSEGGASLKASSSGQSSTTSLSQSTVTVSMSQFQSATEGSGGKKVATPGGPVEKTAQARFATCKLDLRSMVYKKREQYLENQATKDFLSSTAWETRPPPSNWKPKGLLVAHLHEHRGSVNRVRVSHDHAYFATCSNDGTVKLWDCSRLEGKSVTNRSRHTYNKQGGQIKTITFCSSSQSVAAASDSGAIHVFRLDAGSSRISILHTKNLDVESEGLVTDMGYFDTGSQNVICYATVHGLMVGWDLRSAKIAWKLQNDPKQGLITSFDIHPLLQWVALGTSNGTHVCWDMRFQLPITSVTHPANYRVRRLLVNPVEHSSVISAVQGNNEVSVWDLETGARQKTLWASTAPPMSTRQPSSHAVTGMYLGNTDSNSFLLTAGSDMRIRYWDLSYCPNSYIMAHAASDPPNNQVVVSYRPRLIEGTEVVQETYSKPRGATVSQDVPRRGPDTPSTGHHDIITDISLCRTAQSFVISCSRDGVVKVWK